MKIDIYRYSDGGYRFSEKFYAVLCLGYFLSFFPGLNKIKRKLEVNVEVSKKAVFSRLSVLKHSLYGYFYEIS